MLFIFLIVVLSLVILGSIVCALGFQSASPLIFGGVAFVVLLVVFFLSSLTTVSSGEVAIRSCFGTIEAGYMPGNGLQFVDPLCSYEHISVKRTPFEIGADNKTVVISADQNPLTVQVNFGYSPNPALLSKVLTKIGYEYETQLIVRSASSALRDGIGAHSWLEANSSGNGRQAIEASILNAWKSAVVGQLMQSGFTQDEAQNAFEYYPVQLSNALPEQSVQDAIAMKIKAGQDLERQKTITLQAAEIAKRRGAEGQGIANLLSAIPQLSKTMTPEDVASVLHALADKEKADAMLSGVESGKVGTIIFTGAETTTPTGK